MEKLTILLTVVWFAGCKPEPLRQGVITGGYYAPAYQWYGESPRRIHYAYTPYNPVRVPYIPPQPVKYWHHVPERWVFAVRGVTCEGDSCEREINVSEAEYATYGIGDSVFFVCE